MADLTTEMWMAAQWPQCLNRQVEKMYSSDEWNDIFSYLDSGKYLLYVVTDTNNTPAPSHRPQRGVSIKRLESDVNFGERIQYKHNMFSTQENFCRAAS